MATFNSSMHISPEITVPIQSLSLPKKTSRTLFKYGQNQYDIIRCMYRDVRNIHILYTDKLYNAYGEFTDIPDNISKIACILTEHKIYGVIKWSDYFAFKCFINAQPQKGEPYKVDAGVFTTEYIFKNNVFSHATAIINIYTNIGSIIRDNT